MKRILSVAMVLAMLLCTLVLPALAPSPASQLPQVLHRLVAYGVPVGAGVPAMRPDRSTLRVQQHLGPDLPP